MPFFSRFLNENKVFRKLDTIYQDLNWLAVWLQDVKAYYIKKELPLKKI